MTNSELFMTITARTNQQLIAQDLYDCRELIGEISGNELHSLFRDLAGEPSPKGATVVDRDALREHPIGFKMALLLSAQLRDVIPLIAEYHPEYFRV